MIKYPDTAPTFDPGWPGSELWWVVDRHDTDKNRYLYYGGVDDLMPDGFTQIRGTLKGLSISYAVRFAGTDHWLGRDGKLVEEADREVYGSLFEAEQAVARCLEIICIEEDRMIKRILKLAIGLVILASKTLQLPVFLGVFCFVLALRSDFIFAILCAVASASIITILSRLFYRLPRPR